MFGKVRNNFRKRCSPEYSVLVLRYFRTTQIPLEISDRAGSYAAWLTYYNELADFNIPFIAGGHVFDGKQVHTRNNLLLVT